MSFFCISENLTSEGLGDDDDIAVLVASGEIDYGASPQLRENILKQINAGRRHVLLDLSTVTFIDSTAIGVLVAAAFRLKKVGDPSLAVVCPQDNQRVLRILDIAGVPNVVTLYHARDEALSALGTAN
jgi:anti-anti-sigma factor